MGRGIEIPDSPREHSTQPGKVMTEEVKRRSYAVDDVEFIARRLKEIEEERAEQVNNLPSDVEPSAITIKTITLDEYWEFVRNQDWRI